MSEEKAKTEEDVESPREDAPEAPDTGETEAGEELAAELEEYRDQLLRTRAELDNVRKRAEREVENARKFALERFANELLGVRDSLEMGLRAADTESGGLEKLKEGMELTERMLAQAMEKFGVEVLNPEGETFDPSYHEAMSTRESGEHAPNTVLSVMQKGYLLNGRVLRPAMVVVSKRPDGGEDA